jgi:S1-C subfamily serine protease
VPAVVHIKTTTKFNEADGQEMPGRSEDPQEQDQRASGSGGIISNNGYIVTNNHVVNGATSITVTQGIVSAKSGNIGINTQAAAPVESFIQTDAAVNPGSSGGALVNTNGELIAINSAIASTTGSFAGYAYAIPSNLMQKVISDIMKYGSVQRGYLGISMAPEGLDDDKKKELGITDGRLVPPFYDPHAKILVGEPQTDVGQIWPL